MRFCVCTAILLTTLASAPAALVNARIELSEKEFEPGSRINLSGQWFYKPGYALSPREKPQTESANSGFVPVQVPQFLNRVYWWLDDSEDFKKFEDERLKRLGFDTDKAEDGWYRMELDLPAIPSGRHLFLEFDGVAMKCKVYCNGHRLGGHEGMFSRFAFDLTEVLHPGANNLAVYVSMEKIPPSALSMGEAVTVNLTASKVKTMSKGMFGPLSSGADNRGYDLHGIWQPVRLVARGPGAIDDVWFRPSLEGGDLQVTARMFERQAAVIKATWRDLKTGKTLAEIQSPLLQPQTNDFEQTVLLRDVHPKLWSPAEPNLYELTVTLENGAGEPMDQWKGNVGFRTFEIRGNHFFLNGHRWWLRGADHLPYGKNPWSAELPRKLIQLLHDANIQVTRTHATPWNEAWLDAADEIGLGVSIEGIRPWGLCGRVGPTPPDMFQQWLAENEDVVKRCRNHPSVLIYTVGNEMMLKDTENLEKWKQLSAVVKQTRQIDPTRPVIASSEFQERKPQFYESLLKPNGIDDGDIDDLHRYNNWYGPSSFVVDSQFKSEMALNRGRRPLIGQEMSTGYPDLDSGLPVLRYTRDLLTPQAWIGNAAYSGSDPQIFLEHHRAVTKRWAEQLRFQRGTNTAGFMLFASECWFSHSYDPDQIKPYPVYEAMREADAPIGLAWETGRRRFYSGEKIETAVFISNDDNQYRDLYDLKLELAFSDGAVCPLAKVDELPYAKTIRVPVIIDVPDAAMARRPALLYLRLTHDTEVVSTTVDSVEIFERRPEPEPAPNENAISLGPELTRLAAGCNAILLGRGAPLEVLTTGNSIREKIENGATCILFSPGRNIAKLFPDAVLASTNVLGEYADFSPIAGTPLAQGLKPMDLKWWGRTNDWRLFVASEAERLRPGGPTRELIRYIPPHGYAALDKLPEQYWTVLWELKFGCGRLWICDLDLEECVAVDPAARLFAENLFRAASDSDSTKSLPPILSHEELLRGRRP